MRGKHEFQTTYDTGHLTQQQDEAPHTARTSVYFLQKGNTDFIYFISYTARKHSDITPVEYAVLGALYISSMLIRPLDIVYYLFSSAILPAH